MDVQKKKLHFGKSEVAYIAAFLCLLTCLIWAKEESFFQLDIILKMIIYSIILLLTVNSFLGKSIEYNDNLKRYYAALFVFSPFVIFSLYYSENTEIFGIAFFFLGAKGILARKDKWWILWFSLAIGIGEIYCILFLAVVLLLEKRFFHIIRIVIGPFLFGGVVYLAIHYFLNDWINSGNVIWGEMIKKGFPAVAGQEASYLVLGVLLILGICYFAAASIEKIYFYLMVLATLFLISGTFEDYYAAIIIPMLLLVFVNNMAYFRINMILYLIVNLCGALCLIWNQGLALSQIPYIQYYMGVVNACLVAAVLLLWGINYPGKKKFEALADVKCELWIKILNVMIVYPLVLSVRIFG